MEILDNEADFSPLGDLGITDPDIQNGDENPLESDRFGYQEYQGDRSTSPFLANSLDSLEAGMMERPELHDPVIARNATPNIDLSFANGVFDFSAFPDYFESKENHSKPIGQKKEEIIKLCEDVTKDRLGDLEEQDMKYRNIMEAEAQHAVSHQPSLPAWVSEFDADLIDGLKDFVDFID